MLNEHTVQRSQKPSESASRTSLGNIMSSQADSFLGSRKNGVSHIRGVSVSHIRFVREFLIVSESEFISGKQTENNHRESEGAPLRGCVGKYKIEARIKKSRFLRECLRVPEILSSLALESLNIRSRNASQLFRCSIIPCVTRTRRVPCEALSNLRVFSSLFQKNWLLRLSKTEIVFFSGIRRFYAHPLDIFNDQRQNERYVYPTKGPVTNYYYSSDILFKPDSLLQTVPTVVFVTFHHSQCFIDLFVCDVVVLPFVVIFCGVGGKWFPACYPSPDVEWRLV